MKKYVIAFDLDGTLLSPDGKFSSDTINNLKQIHNLGHHIVLATGRPYIGCIDLYNELLLTSPLITDNGAFTAFPQGDKSDIRKLIPRNTMNSWFNDTKHLMLAAMYNSDHLVYVYKDDQELAFLYHRLQKENVIMSDFDQTSDLANGFIVRVSTKDLPEFSEIMANNYVEHLNFRSWGERDDKHLLEVYQNDVSKASALKHLLDTYYLLPLENLITVGDGTNDLEMISVTKKGIAMLNANDKVKAVANHISTYDNSESGATRAVLEMINSKY